MLESRESRNRVFKEYIACAEDLNSSSDPILLIFAGECSSYIVYTDWGAEPPNSHARGGYSPPSPPHSDAYDSGFIICEADFDWGMCTCMYVCVPVHTGKIAPKYGTICASNTLPRAPILGLF